MQRRNDRIDMKHWENCKPSNRSFLEEDVKQLYKMRSEFVHGNIRFKVADFDGDNRAEVWVTGPSASANSIAGILDVSNEEVKCVFNGWGKEWGRYTDPETGQTGLVIAEGNSDGEGYTHTRESLYDENWDCITLLETENNGIESTNVNTNDEVYEQIRSNCTETESVAEIESDNMDKQEIISFLQSLTGDIRWE